MRLPAFQQQAVARILSRLKSRHGVRRFLLADEVGLGKTHVAKGVIEGLKRKRQPLVVFYISSSREIAHQNRRKLAQVGADEPVDDRLTLFARHVHSPSRLRSGAVRLLTLTPGTSLYLGRSTGVSEERLLILYLIRRFRPRLFKKRLCREGFRCGVRSSRAWRRSTQWRELQHRFPARFDARLQRELRKEWRSPLKQLAALVRSRKKVKRKEWSQVIGEFRRGLARSVVLALDPGLIVLDEFQRFRELIQQPGAAVEKHGGNKRLRHQTHVLADWFFPDSANVETSSRASRSRPTCPPVLLLSATPYRPYANSLEDGGDGAHLRELLEVLGFVAGARRGDARLADLSGDFVRFRKRIEGLAGGDARDPELMELKRRIEIKLKQWMCRTERNWYYADECKGVEDVRTEGPRDQWPQPAEAAELRDLSTLLVRSGAESAAQVIDYWKSCPACLSFMFDQYEVQRRLGRMRGAQVRLEQRRLLVRMRDLPGLFRRNLKLRLLAQRLFTGPGSNGDASALERGVRSWRYLWCAPTYRYWSDGLFASDPADAAVPEKALVFSHWRFVPGAIGLLISKMVERGLGCGSEAAWRKAEPLRFRQDGSLGVFDVCFPSVGLALVVDPTRIALDLGRGGRRVTLADIEGVAQRDLKRALMKVGILVASTRALKRPGLVTNLWKAVARLDAGHTPVVSDRHAIDSWLPGALGRHRPAPSRREVDAQSYESDAVRRFREWAKPLPEGPLEISPRLFGRLVRIAVHSPAVGLLRAVRRAVPDAPVAEWYGAALTAGFSGIRNYFNRAYARAIIDKHAKGAGYADRVLNYCGSAQLQAVWDEYAHLLAEQETSVDRDPNEVAAAMLRGIVQVLSLGLGAPRVRVRKSGPGKPWKTKVGRSHFALAFAEESSEDGGGRSRRRHTREAFNSPFWPFVLATTSVGQEGLDFHWYCRNVVHWNLPSNPVDLEQREGRVNRRDGLVVRRGLARDIPLRQLSVDHGKREGVWPAAFRLVQKHMEGAHHERHGLFPHWLYEGQRPSRKQERIRRHEFSYWGSRDRVRYGQLKQDLALYRLAFGQANQEDLLARLREKAEGTIQGARGLEAYMLNLAPFPKGAAWRAAQNEASMRLKTGDVRWVRTLLRDVNKILRKYETVLGARAVDAARKLAGRTSRWLIDPSQRHISGKTVAAAAALTYLRNPYDDQFDVHRLVGFQDDAHRLIEVARRG